MRMVNDQPESSIIFGEKGMTAMMENVHIKVRKRRPRRPVLYVQDRFSGYDDDTDTDID